MGDIHLLEDRLIDKIAAGEVVENPATLLKELIENSIDAGSTKISVETKEGGTSLIKVVDNGKGMSRDDALLSVKRHATSKIQDEEDLFAIHTLGFRGEALASISAVSDFSIITKQEGEVKGTIVSVIKEATVEDSPSEIGTTVIVKNLFHNVPARKKFLRSKSAELSSMIDVITNYALAYPELAFQFVHDGKTHLQTTGTDNALNTITSIYGAETAKQMVEFNAEKDDVKIQGFLGKPSISRHDKQRQVLFLNGRNIKSKEISQAVKDGYHSMLFLEKEPVYVLHLTLDEKKLDVNVHPRKEIVKITEIDKVTDLIKESVYDALQKENLIPEVEFSPSRAKPTHGYAFSTDKQSTLLAGDDPEGFRKIGSVAEETDVSSLGKDVQTSVIGPFRILGQVNRTYIIAEAKDGLLLVDQHAAEERVNYEKLMAQLKDKAIKKQELLEPLLVEVSPSEKEMVLHYQEELLNSGFEIDDRGEGQILLRTVPFVFERPSKVLVHDLIDELKQISDKKLSQQAEDRIIRFSCRKSIKAGDILSTAEIERLIRELDRCEIPFTCPHGRPTIVKMSLAELERKFKRTG